MPFLNFVDTYASKSDPSSLYLFQKRNKAVRNEGLGWRRE